MEPAPALSAPPDSKTPVAAPSFGASNARVTSSTSASKQFIVYGNDLQARSQISSRCDAIAADLSRLLRDKQSWVLPIVVRTLTGEAAVKEPGDVVKATVSQIADGGFHLQINVKLIPTLRPIDFRNEVVRALLAERILRGVKQIEAKRAVLPDWVYTGILEAMDYRQRARPSTFFAAIFKSGKIYGIEEIIEASPVEMDALSKTIYQTSCCALVLALLDQPESGIRFGKFLGSLATDTRTERDILNQWFPGFASSASSLNKWWSLQLASLAAPGMGEPLSIAETVKQLNEALTFHFQAKASEAPKPRPVTVATVKASPPAPPRKLITDVEPMPPINVASKPEAAPAKPPGKEEAAKPKAKSAAADSETSQETTDAAVAATTRKGPKPLFDRWFDDSENTEKGDQEKEKDSKPSKAQESEPAKKAESKPSEKDKAAAEEEEENKSGGFKLFGRGKKDNPEETEETQAKDKKTEAKSKAQPNKKAQDAKSDSAAKPDDKEEEKKPSAANPLNWFRGKKDKEEETDSAAKEKDQKKTSMLPALENALWAWSPLVGDFYAAVPSRWIENHLTTPASRQVEGFLGLKFGKKKEGEEAAEPKKAEPAKPKAEKPKVEKKKAEPTLPPSEAPKTDKSKKEEEAPEPTSAEPKKRRGIFSGGDKEEEKEKSEETPKEEAPKTEANPPEQAAKPAPKPKPALALRKKKPASPEDEKLVSVSLPIEDYAHVAKQANAEEIFQRTQLALANLQERSSILFRSLIIEYQAALMDMRKGKMKDMDARLAQLRTRTIQAAEQSVAVRDFVDVYEANESGAYSGQFDDYLNLPATIQKELPPRSDPISTYLDALEKEFTKD